MTDKPKQIFINARFLTQSITGVQRYAVEFVKSLDKLIDSGVIDGKQYSFVMLAPREIKYELNLQHIPLILSGRLKGHLWEQLELPFYTKDRLLVNLCNAGPLIKSRQTVTIHDAAVFGFPQAYSLAFRAWYKVLLTGLGKVSKKIFTDSVFSKKELIKYCHISEHKIQVVPLGKEHIFTAEPDRAVYCRYNLTNGRYVIAVSSMSPNKNFHSIVQAIELLGDSGYDIVIAGGVNPKVFSRSPAPFPESVKHVGYVSDGELRALYEHAACFVYPSFYEGFGLPPLEAMACGCPVIVSKTASLPEVCGDAVLYCDPDNPEDIADKIKQLMNDETLRETLRQKGLARASLFTWEKCTRDTFAEIKEILKF